MTAVVERVDGLERFEVDGVPCVSYPQLTGSVDVGDDVVVNVQARELGLGSGGFDVLYVNLSRGLEARADAGAHVMKLPYTPVQFAAAHLEETRETRSALGGMPVVCCTLHSQVAPVCAGIGGGVRVAYVQVAGGALSVSLSDSVRGLRARGLVERTISVGACFGGDATAVTLASALSWAAAEELDAVVCAIGPGIVGTSTPYGHGGVAAAEAANAAGALGGTPVIAVRASEADARDRHRGMSHHMRAVFDLCLVDVRIARPAGRLRDELDAEPGVVEVDVSDWRDACGGLALSHMGRGPDDDPLFFETAFAAGRLARSLVR